MRISHCIYFKGVDLNKFHFQVQAYTFLGQLIDMDNSKLSLKESISYDVLKNMLNTYTDGFSWIK